MSTAALTMIRAIFPIVLAPAPGGASHRPQRGTQIRRLGAALVVWGVSVMGRIGGGYRWGESVARAALHKTEHGFAEAFRGGAQDASVRLSLMRVNDVRAAVQACERDNLWTDKVGRRACSLDVWLDPSPCSVP